MAFAEGTPFIGDLQYLFLNGVGSAPNPDYAATIPHETFMIYQLMFAIITPALISGAFAERMKFSAHAAVHDACGRYRVLSDGAHGLGQGRTVECLSRRQDSDVRFRRRHGGAHHFRRFGALVCALYLGKRTGYPNEPMKPHSMVLSMIGACLLWVGWFGFNAGSAAGVPPAWRPARLSLRTLERPLQP